jgi:rhodanese-related sulfurtransferase
MGEANAPPTRAHRGLGIGHDTKVYRTARLGGLRLHRRRRQPSAIGVAAHHGRPHHAPMTEILAQHSRVAADPDAAPVDALAHFTARLAYECDPADVAADLRAGAAAFVLVDCRSREAYARAHLPGAVRLPHAEIDEAALAAVAAETLLVTYCWGPGCNAATRGARRIAALGRPVKEMIGGFEYWVREGLPLEGAAADGYARDASGLVGL